jgi:RNA polymerase sigma-70 factor (ECF subfamily)
MCGYIIERDDLSGAKKEVHVARTSATMDDARVVLDPWCYMIDEPTPMMASLLRLKAGDAAAREALFVAAQARLLTLVRNLMRHYSMLRRYEDSDDVLQEVLLKLVTKLHTLEFENTNAFFGLVSLVVRQQLCNLMRHYFGAQGLGRREIGGEAYIHELHDAPNLADHADDSEALARWTELHDAITKLPADQRQVFEWHWYLGLTLVEIAAHLGVSTKTVERCWARTRLHLANLLGQDFFE